LQEIRRSRAWEHARRLVASVYGATQPWAAAPPGPVRALRRASVAAAVSLLEADTADTADTGAPLTSALAASRAALQEVARQARLCRQEGHLPEAAERDLLAEHAAVEAALRGEPGEAPRT
jgi:hypothetical protein